MRQIITVLIVLLSSSFLWAEEVVKWNYSSQEREEGVVELIFKGKIDNDWYIYSSKRIENGPMATSFEVEKSSAFETVAPLNDYTKALEKHDPAFGLDIKYFLNEAQFVYTIKRKESGPFTVKGELQFQSCSGDECLINFVDVDIAIPPLTKKEGAEALAATQGNKSQPLEPMGATEQGVEAGQSSVAEQGADKERATDKGMLGFLLVAIVAGLGGVFTPCVFPMIPMTVGFFLGSGENRGSAITKGLIFGLSVTLIYTAVGVIVALFQSTEATDIMGSHWIPNLLFAILFIIFAISFFGAFEITLPSGLANKADAKADKGGYIAAFFVAFAMVIVSFSCTGPFVGSILAAAVTGGLAIKPILGMAFFGMAFSAPFVLFSLFPSLMKKLPKSGGWLNSVKVVFAFVLLGFSIKFLSSVDLYFGWGVISRAFAVSVWIVLSILLGLYLLGKLRTRNDSPVESVGVFPLFLAIASFTFAIYLLPGLFGAPLNSLSGLLPPPDSSTALFVGQASTGAEQSDSGITTGLCGEAPYATEKNRVPYSLPSYYTIEDAIECAKEQNKPILLSFKAVTCSVCKVMESTVWSDPQVLNLLGNEVVLATLYVDDRSELPLEEQFTSALNGKVVNTLGKKLREYQLTRFNTSSQPFYVLIDHSENVLGTPIGSCSVEEYINFLKSGVEQFHL
ncbi:MAG: cytochrome c biogenesis protein CcdA [Bacteroidales bacterium]